MTTRKLPSWPGFGSRCAATSARGGMVPTSVSRQPFSSSSGRFGTLTFSTTGSAGRSRTRPPTTAAATDAAVGHSCAASTSSQPWPSTPRSATSWLTATPEMPPLRAVIAAPTVPEW